MPATEDERALARYRYLVQTARPETIEQAYVEAFARLTPAQRAYARRSLVGALPPAERAALDTPHDDPRSLAVLATRAELARPGVVERGLGGLRSDRLMTGTIMGSLVAGFLGSLTAQQFMKSLSDLGADALDMTGWEDALPAVSVEEAKPLGPAESLINL